MPTLDIIPSSAATAFNNERTPAIGGSARRDDEPFGDLMERTLAKTWDKSNGNPSKLKSTAQSTSDSRPAERRERSRQTEKSKTDSTATDNAAIVAANNPAPAATPVEQKDGDNGEDGTGDFLNSPLRVGESPSAVSENSGGKPELTDKASGTAKTDLATSPNAAKASKSAEPAKGDQAGSTKNSIVAELAGENTADGKSITPAANVATANSPPGRENAANAETSAESLASSPSNPTGISVAQEDTLMKKAIKKNNFAGSTGKVEQVLPQDVTATASGENLPGHDKALLAATSRVEHAESLAANNSSSERPIEIHIASGEGTSASSAIADIRARSLERTENLVAFHATRFSESSTDVMNVTLKPGAGLELSLELRQGDNGIEAHATLQHGDFKYLSSHWAELQQRLEARGVRLAPLSCSEQLSHGDTHHFSQSRHDRSQPDDPAYAGAFADFVMAGSFAKQAVRGVAQRGWESWA